MSATLEDKVLTPPEEPLIIKTDQVGIHNANLDAAVKRMPGEKYRDTTTAMVTLFRDFWVPLHHMNARRRLQYLMNARVHEIQVAGMEVAAGYNYAVARVMSEYPDAKYLLTLESDNLPPWDGMLKLFQSLHGEVDGVEYAGVSGLYWGKGKCGAPMIFGRPDDLTDYAPVRPEEGKVIECNGIPMGFSLYRMDLFKDERFAKDKDGNPEWFKNYQVNDEGHQTVIGQDLWFCQSARALGYRFAVDCRVKVGHLDVKDWVVY